MKTVNSRKSVWTIAGIALGVVLFCGWYAIAANYDYSSLCGTYFIAQNGETCKLRLVADQTFSEELNRSGRVQVVHGQWRRYGEAHVSFSSEFLKLSGQELNESGEAHGQFSKRLGVFPILHLGSPPGWPEPPQDPHSLKWSRPSIHLSEMPT
jgi:hypothetical protein